MIYFPANIHSRQSWKYILIITCCKVKVSFLLWTIVYRPVQIILTYSDCLMFMTIKWVIFPHSSDPQVECGKPTSATCNNLFLSHANIMYQHIGAAFQSIKVWIKPMFMYSVHFLLIVIICQNGLTLVPNFAAVPGRI